MWWPLVAECVVICLESGRFLERLQTSSSSGCTAAASQECICFSSIPGCGPFSWLLLGGLLRFYSLRRSEKIAFFLGSPFPVPQGLALVSFLCPSPTQKVCCVECGFWQSPVVQVRTQGTLTVCLASPPIMRTLASNLHLSVLHLACNLLA